MTEYAIMGCEFMGLHYWEIVTGDYEFVDVALTCGELGLSPIDQIEALKEKLWTVEIGKDKHSCIELGDFFVWLLELNAEQIPEHLRSTFIAVQEELILCAIEVERREKGLIYDA